MTMVLLSCSDNSNPLAEELNSQQTQILQKVNTGASPEATGSQKVNSGRAMGVAAVPVGSRACSNEINYLFTSPPTNATITSLAFSLGTPSTNVGSFTIDTLKIRCNPPPNPNETKIPWNGTSPNPITTTYFNGQPARNECYVSFCGKCIAGYMVAGQMVNQCNKGYTSTSLTVNYQY
jgi:hypothetical protein